MVTLYIVEVGGKPRGPLTGHQVLKLFDAGEVSKVSRFWLANDPNRLAKGSGKSIGESRLFVQFDDLRGAAATPPSRFLGELVQAVRAQTQELQTIRHHLWWLRITLGLVILCVVLFGLRVTVR